MTRELLLSWMLLADSLPTPCPARSIDDGFGTLLRREGCRGAPPQGTDSSNEIVAPNFRCHAFGQGIFVGVGAGPFVQISTDGLTWTQHDSGTPSSLRAIAYGSGLFVAVGNEGIALTSSDGIDWTSRN